MCIGGYIVEFCNQQQIPCDDLTIELSRRIQPASPKVTSSGIKLSRTAQINAKILLGTELSEKQRQDILEVAEYCHITNSIREGMQIICTLA